jgi:hypothetical protein
MVRSFLLALSLFTISLAAVGHDRVELELRNLEVVMSEEVKMLMRSVSEIPDKPLQPVELRWTDGSAVLPDGATAPISLDIRFVPEASMALEPGNQMTFLSNVSGRLRVDPKGATTEWRIEQANYGPYFAKTHWFYDKGDSGWRFGVHLPLAFLRETDKHRVVAHMFVAFSESDEKLAFRKAWMIPRLGGNPSEAPDKPSALFTRAIASFPGLASLTPALASSAGAVRCVIGESLLPCRATQPAVGAKSSTPD